MLSSLSRCICAAFILFSALGCVSASAAERITVWIGPAGGSWSNAANWSNGLPATDTVNGVIVRFGANSSSVMDIPNLIVDQINFTGTGNTISGNGPVLGVKGNISNSNILDNAGGNTIAAPLNLQPGSSIFCKVDAGQLTISGVISGSANTFRVLGSGATGVIFTGFNTYTSRTTVATGTLHLNSNGTDLSIQNSIGIDVGVGNAGGATLILDQSLEIANNIPVAVLADGTFNLNNKSETVGALTVSGGTVQVGTVGLTVNGALNMSGGSITGTGNLTLGGDVVATSLSSGSATISAPVRLNGSRTFTVNTGTQAIDLNLTGVIANGTVTSAVTKAGSGVMQINGAVANTYTGGTIVQDGTLIPTGASTQVIPAGTLTVGDGAGVASSAILKLGNTSVVDNTAVLVINADGEFITNSFFEQVGSTTLNGGKITVSTSAFSSGPLLMNDGVITGTTGSLTLGTSLNMTGGSIALPALTLPINVTATSSVVGSASINCASIVLSGGSRTFTVNPGTAPEFVLRGVVSDGGNALGINKIGTGTMNLTGASTNTFTGQVNVSRGTLQLLQDTGRTISGPIVIGNNVDQPGSATLRELINNDLAQTVTIQIGSSGVLDMNGKSDAIATLSGSGSILLPSAAILSVNVDNSTSTFSGAISGDGTFRKAGSGMLSLTGVNPLTGRLTCNDGILLLNNATPNSVCQAATLQVGDGAGIANSAIVRLGAANQIADATALDIRSDGQLDLNNVNETLAGGSVFSGDIALGTATLSVGGPLNLNDGVIAPGTGTLVLNSDVTATSTTTGSVISATTQLNGVRTFTVNNGAVSPDLILGGAVSNGVAAGGITKLGAGTLRLAGSTNTFDGTSTFLAGVTELNATSTTALRGTIVIGNNFDPADTAVVRDLIQLNIPATANIQVNTSGTLDLNNFAERCGILSGTGKVTLGTGVLQLAAATPGEFSGVISGTGANAIIFNGTSVQTFSGTNTYAGTTVINGGVLEINGTQLQSAVTVGALGTLAGRGGVGPVMVNGTVAPSDGVLKTGPLTFAATSKLLINVNSAVPRCMFLAAGDWSGEHRCRFHVRTHARRGRPGRRQTGADR